MIRVLTGDCRTMLATLPDASVQMVCTSPPYFNLRSYLDDGHPDKALEIGAEQTPDAYVAELVAVFRDVRRVLADTGVVFLNLGDSYAGSWGARGRGEDTNAARPDLEAKYGIGAPARRGYATLGIKPKDLMMMPAMVALALRQDGWYLRSAITWCKTAPMPESVCDRPTSATEMVFLLTKASRYFYDAQAVAEPAEESSLSRLAQNVEDQAGSLRANGGAKTNGPMRAVGGATRNARNWWVINPQPYSGAHFATMPADLASTCIRAGSSERGQCPHCGAPWARVVERTVADDRLVERIRNVGGRDDGYTRTKASGGLPPVVSNTTGWSPTCACPAHTPVPQTVLDPFFGAGTTGLVADRLGRNCIGIELNPEYAALARSRIAGDAPLFAEVA